jgi:hypothetical protein
VAVGVEAAGVAGLAQGLAQVSAQGSVPGSAQGLAQGSVPVSVQVLGPVSVQGSAWAWVQARVLLRVRRLLRIPPSPQRTQERTNGARAWERQRA